MSNDRRGLPIRLSLNKGTLPARPNGDFCGEAGDLVQWPIVDDLGIVGPLRFPSDWKKKNKLPLSCECSTKIEQRTCRRRQWGRQWGSWRWRRSGATRCRTPGAAPIAIRPAWWRDILQFWNNLIAKLKDSLLVLTWRHSPRPRHTPAWAGGPTCSCAQTAPCDVGFSL